MTDLNARNIYTGRGRKLAINYQQSIDAPALEEAINKYQPYLKAIHGEGSQILDELNDLVEVKKIISQKSFDKDTAKLTGTPTVMSVESGISRMYSIVRGVVSARYVLTELGLRTFRLGQAEVIKKFLTDPTAVSTLHDVYVKGLNDPYYTRKLFNQIFSTPTMAIIASRAEQLTGADKYPKSPITFKGKDDKNIQISDDYFKYLNTLFSDVEREKI